jgi:hypothetical protein
MGGAAACPNLGLEFVGPTRDGHLVLYGARTAWPRVRGVLQR